MQLSMLELEEWFDLLSGNRRIERPYPGNGDST
jgi:hypothetical protein